VAQLHILHAASAAAHFVSISGGIAVFDPRTTTTAGQLIAAADQALFQAKSLGRNWIDSGGDDRKVRHLPLMPPIPQAK
jgi:PleD family two-component response regulator